MINNISKSVVEMGIRAKVNSEIIKKMTGAKEKTMKGCLQLDENSMKKE
jgi:hypothetical protein